MAPLLMLLVLGSTDSLPARNRARAPRAGQVLSEALEDLRAAGLKLVYSTDLVRAEMRVQTDPIARSPREIADQILAPYDLTLRDGPAGILLVVRQVSAPEALGGIHGRVRIQGTLRPVADALVLLPGTPAHLLTDRDGRFLIPNLPPGAYTLEVRLPGLRAQHFENVTVAPGQITERDLDVAVASGYVERVVVKPGEESLQSGRTEARETFPADALNRMAQLGNDLQRAVVRLPGAAGGDKTAAVNVRGGDRDEVQVVLDGLEIEEPFHLKDFLAYSGIVEYFADGESIVVAAKGHTLRRKLWHPRLQIIVEDKQAKIRCEFPRRREAALVGTFAAHLRNMIVGVTEGFTYEMKIVYSHFPVKAMVKGTEIVIENFLGEKFPRKTTILGDTKVKINGDQIVLTGPDVESVGQTAANIEQATRIKGFDPRIFQDGIYITKKAGEV